MKPEDLEYVELSLKDIEVNTLNIEKEFRILNVHLQNIDNKISKIIDSFTLPKLMHLAQVITEMLDAFVPEDVKDDT